MKKQTVLGIMALAMAITVAPVNVKASETSTYQIAKPNKVIVLNGSCDINSIKEQIQNIFNNMGNNCIPNGGENTIPGDDQQTEDDNITNDDTSNDDTSNDDIIIDDSIVDGPVVTPDDNTQDNNTDQNVEKSYAQQVVDLVNIERAKEGLSPLTIDANVTKAANVRAVEIQSSFSHTRPNGSKFSTALTENGVSYRGSGENIAYGQRTPQEVVTGWMNSAGHRANIMNANFKNIGVGYQVNNGVGYWVQLFTY